MNELLETAKEIEYLCGERGWKFCFIGGLALQRWGELRVTKDVDLTLLTGFGHEEDFISALLKKFQPRRADAMEFAIRQRVLLLVSKNRVGIDIAMGALPYEEDAIGRATRFEYSLGYSLTTCSAEDLVVMKGFAARPRDWEDIKGVLIRQGRNLDRTYIRRQLKPLADLKEAPEIMQTLEALFTRHTT